MASTEAQTDSKQWLSRVTPTRALHSTAGMVCTAEKLAKLYFGGEHAIHEAAADQLRWASSRIEHLERMIAKVHESTSPNSLL